MKPTLSIIVFTKNEAANIAACLKTAVWADEVILVDDYSEDDTLKIARRFKKVKIFQHRLVDFASQHNFGMKKASGNWLFFLDADERISPALKHQIQSAIKDPQGYAAFKVNRVNIFFGQRMRSGGWSPDTPTRLFKKENLKGWVGMVHESAQVDGSVGQLSAPLYHFTHRSLTQMLQKTIHWSQFEAELRLKAHHPPVTWWRILRMGATEFCYRLIKKQGWRDGMVGWIEVIYQTISMMITYLRLWEMQNRLRIEKAYQQWEQKVYEDQP